MFDVKSQRLLVLTQPAVLTAVVGTLAGELTEPRIHQEAPAWARSRLALAWRMPIKVLVVGKTTILWWRITSLLWLLGWAGLGADPARLKR